MEAAAVRLFQPGGFPKAFQERPRKSRARRREDGGVRIGGANGFRRGEGQGRVLLHVRLWLPKGDVRLVPDFPNDVAALKMFRRRRRPARKRGDAFGMLRGSQD